MHLGTFTRQRGGGGEGAEDQSVTSDSNDSKHQSPEAEQLEVNEGADFEDVDGAIEDSVAELDLLVVVEQLDGHLEL